MVRIVTIGSSAIVRRALDALAGVPGLEHVGAYSRSRERAREVIPRDDALVFDDLATLAASRDVDAVYVASPNALHAAQAAALLEGGKHVLVEKSATSTAAEFAALRERADRRGVVLMEAMRNAAYDPGTAALARLLPELGTLRSVRLEYSQRSSRWDRFRAGEQVNIFDASMSGGALMDIGVYCAHLAVELFGEPDEVAGARMSPVRGGIDGAGAVLLGYAAATVTLVYSKVADSGLPSELHGDEGTLVVDQAHDPRTLTLHRASGATEDVTVPKAQDNIVYSFAEFERLVSSGASADRWNDVTLKRLRLTDEIRSRLGLVFPADRPHQGP